jgi:hypothetical protein
MRKSLGIRKILKRENVEEKYFFLYNYKLKAGSIVPRIHFQKKYRA